MLSTRRSVWAPVTTTTEPYPCSWHNCEHPAEDHIAKPQQHRRTFQYKCSVPGCKCPFYSPKFPPNKCHWCDKTDDDNMADGYGPCVDIQIVIANGEEGHSDVKRYACDEHLTEVTEKLIGMGFGVHVHGGACLLEDTECIGATNYGSCPTPEEQYPD